MSVRTSGAADAVPSAFDAGRLGRLTWLGLAIATLGWALLIAAAGLGDRLAARAGVAFAPTLHADMVEVARCMIGSGFALAVIGALQTGFGALNRFFAAVLTRSSPPRQASAMPTAPSVAPMPAPMPTPMAMDRTAEPLRERRPYEILADGSVEVETIVGTRRFESMDEAREFI